MKPTKFTIELGETVRALRQSRDVSVSELAEQLGISDDELRRYERGDRAMPLERVISACVALNCSAQNVIEALDPRLSGAAPITKVMNALSPPEHKIVRHMATDWDGDRKALLIACGVYMTLPPHRRREAMMALDIIKDEALLANEISPADLPEELEYLQQALGGLYNTLK